MRIALVGLGTWGDVHPMLVFGDALQRRGHTVTIVAFADFRDAICQRGLGMTPVEISVRAALSTGAGARLIQRANTSSSLAELYLLHRFMQQHGHAMMDGVVRAALDADVLVSNFISDVYADSIASAVGIQHVIASLQPTLVPTRDGRVALNPPRPDRVSYLNLLFRQLLVEPTKWWVLGALTNRFRRTVLDLHDIDGKTCRQLMRRRLIIQAYSRHVVPHPRDWPQNIHTCGYWFAPPSSSSVAPALLTQFLAEGDMPIYVGFGSMTSGRAAELSRLVIAALEIADRRAVVQAGWSGITPLAASSRVYALAQPVSHEWLFPKVAAVVHHAGAGTTAEGVRAGKPTVPVPHVGDQFFWAHRLTALGIGTEPIPQSRLTARGLAEAIENAASDPLMKSRAVSLAQRVRSERGVEVAVDLLETSTSSES